MILADGLFAVSRIDYRLEPHDWAFARDEATRVDAHWADIRLTKPKLFDGRVLLAHRLEISGDRLRGACFETSYKSFLGWRDFDFPGEPLANCFGMAALVSTDGAFMLGEMSAGTANGGKLYFPAGTPEPADADADGRVDLEANVLRELAEETGIGSDEVALGDGWTVVADGPRVACLKLIHARDTAAALQARLSTFNATQRDPELVRLLPVSRESDLDEARMPAFMVRYLRAMLALPDRQNPAGLQAR